MAHEITIRANGKAEMAFVEGTKPWHGLGDELRSGAPIEEWIPAAGMDWSIRRSKVRYATERDGAGVLEYPDQHVLFRSDTKAPLGLVSPKYKVVQPREVLEFFRDLTEENGFTLTTAGTLFGGKRMWGLASIGENAVIAGRDQVGGYLLLSTSCDGSLPTTARFTTVCVVCNNTLSMALRGDPAQVTISHRLEFDHNRVKDELGVARGRFHEFMANARELSHKPVDIEQAEVLTASLLTGASTLVPHDLLVDDKVRNSHNFKRIMALFNGDGMGSKLDGRAGTAWGWVNAVTENVDHHAKAMTDSHRLNSAWFGAGDKTKTEALQLALAA